MDKYTAAPWEASIWAQQQTDAWHALLFYYHFIIIHLYQASCSSLLISLCNFSTSTSTFVCQRHTRCMSQLLWLKYKGKHGKISRSGRCDFEAENETALTFPVLNYADGGLASSALSEYFSWQSGSNMLIMTDVDQGPKGIDGIQISNNIPLCWKLISDLRDVSHKNPCKDNGIQPACRL